MRADVFEKKDFATLLKDGEIVHRQWSNAEVETLFAGTEGSGLDPIALSEPTANFVDLYVAYLNAPTIGKALLGESEYKKLMGRMSPGQSAYWVAAAGRQLLVDDDFVRGSVPARLTLNQNGVPLEARDGDLPAATLVGSPAFNSILVLKTPDLSGLDPGRAITIGLDVVREKGQVYPTRIRQTLNLEYTAPARYFSFPPPRYPNGWLPGGHAGRNSPPSALRSFCSASPWHDRAGCRSTSADWLSSASVFLPSPSFLSAGTPKANSLSSNSPGRSKPWLPARIWAAFSMIRSPCYSSPSR